MALNFEDKKAIVAEVTDAASGSISLVVADYRGLSVPEMTDLRNKAREADVYLKVVRNTLAKRALQGTDFECMEAVLGGPLIFGFAKNEPGSAARLFKNFSKDHKALEVKGLSVAGQFYDADQLDAVASLPSRDEALAQLAATLLAPATKLARTIQEPAGMLARALNALEEKKQAEGAA